MVFPHLVKRVCQSLIIILLLISSTAVTLAASAGGGSSAVKKAIVSDIILESGWNIVSTPMVLNSHEFSAPETVDNFDIYVLDASAASGWSTMADLGQDEFEPLYGYFINNKTGAEQTLTLDYKLDLGTDEKLFARVFNAVGWYSIGVADAEYAKTQTAGNADTDNPANILVSLAGEYDRVIDFTDADYDSSRYSVSLSDPWKAAVPADVNSLNDLRDTKGYAVYINKVGADYSGFQNDPVAIDPTLVSLSIESSSSNPDTTTLLVNKGLDESDEHVLHIFDIRTGGSPSDTALLDKAFVDVTISNPNYNDNTTVDSVIADLYLDIGGTKVRGVATDALGSNDADADVTGEGEVRHVIAADENNTVRYQFEFGDLELNGDTDHEVVVSVVFKGQENNYQQLVTIATHVDGSLWTTGGSEDTHTANGSDRSETHAIAGVIPIISDTSFEVDRNEAGDAGVISFEFNIEAYGGEDVEFFFGDVEDVQPAGDAVEYIVTGPAADYVATITRVSGNALSEGLTGWTIEGGDQAAFIIDFVFAEASPAGVYRVTIDSILGFDINYTSGPLSLTD